MKIKIPDSEIEEHFVRSSGPGGQNVNKVSTAVELRFAVARSPSLPAGMRIVERVTAYLREMIDGTRVEPIPPHFP